MAQVFLSARHFACHHHLRFVAGDLFYRFYHGQSPVLPFTFSSTMEQENLSILLVPVTVTNEGL